MACSAHLLLAVTLCCALQYTAATDQSLECYACIGYDENADEDPVTNNKACAVGSFSADSVQTRNNTAPQGDVQLQCIVLTITNGYANSGRPVTYRGPYNSTRTEPFRMRDAPNGEGEADLRWCSSALCNGDAGNGAAGKTPVAIATLLAALALYGLVA